MAEAPGRDSETSGGPHAPSVFICYRRDDTAGYAGRIYDTLRTAFGRASLFMDVDNIAPGVDFVEDLGRAVARCDVLLAIIGPHWLAPAGAAGKPRLDDANDFVRVEIESALRRGILVIPILVQGATMPAPDDLPPSLRPWARAMPSR